MKIDPISPQATQCLVLEDGSATFLESLTELLVAEIKGHGHYGNVTHHVARGDWDKVSSALRELLVLPPGHLMLSPLARNLATMLDGKSAANLRPFRNWLLDKVEAQTTSLYRRSLARRLEALVVQIRAA
ncbi:MAG: hypothetical protein KKF33_19385 [Alphaproteobacteria bacterium]|nr:hypothetical protein [Alphaproteobacteria bacterium]